MMLMMMTMMMTMMLTALHTDFIRLLFSLYFVFTKHLRFYFYFLILFFWFVHFWFLCFSLFACRPAVIRIYVCAKKEAEKKKHTPNKIKMKR